MLRRARYLPTHWPLNSSVLARCRTARCSDRGGRRWSPSTRALGVTFRSCWESLGLQTDPWRSQAPPLAEDARCAIHVPPTGSGPNASGQSGSREWRTTSGELSTSSMLRNERRLPSAYRGPMRLACLYAGCLRHGRASPSVRMWLPSASARPARGSMAWTLRRRLSTNALWVSRRAYRRRGGHHGSFAAFRRTIETRHSSLRDPALHPQRPQLTWRLTPWLRAEPLI
jgi:hypothetical protein